MKTKRFNLFVLLTTVVLASMVLGACGTAPGLYTVQSVQMFDQKVEYFAPANNLIKTELVLTLPEGDGWAVVVKEAGCRAFQLNEDNLPTAEISLNQGDTYPSGRKFSLSCPTGKVYWTKVTTVTSSTPTK